MSYLNKLRGKRAKAGPEAVLQVSKAVIDTITPTIEQEPKAESLNRVTTITTFTTKASQTQVSPGKKYDKRSGFVFQGARAKTFGKTKPTPEKQFRVIPFWFTSRQVKAGEKTQTRRRLDDYTRSWREGETFAAVDEHKEIFAHIKALVIRKQRLGDITEDEAAAEGFKDLAAFRAEWIKYYRVFDAALEVLVLEFRVLPAAELRTGTAVPVLTELPELSEPAQPDKHVSQHASFTDLAVDFLEATERILVTWKDERPPVLRTPQLKRELAAVENALSAYRAVLLPDDPESRAVGESLANRYRGLN